MIGYYLKASFLENTLAWMNMKHPERARMASGSRTSGSSFTKQNIMNNIIGKRANNIKLTMP